MLWRGWLRARSRNGDVEGANVRDVQGDKRTATRVGGFGDGGRCPTLSRLATRCTAQRVGDEARDVLAVLFVLLGDGGMLAHERAPSQPFGNTTEP